MAAIPPWSRPTLASYARGVYSGYILRARRPYQRKGVIAMARCAGIRANGERCKGTAMGSLGYCYAHNPETAQARSEAASRGGKRGGRGRPLTEIRSARAHLLEITRKV